MRWDVIVPGIDSFIRPEICPECVRSRDLPFLTLDRAEEELAAAVFFDYGERYSRPHLMEKAVSAVALDALASLPNKLWTFANEPPSRMPPGGLRGIAYDGAFGLDRKRIGDSGTDVPTAVTKATSVRDG